jgi:hypothetical protein
VVKAVFYAGPTLLEKRFCKALLIFLKQSSEVVWFVGKGDAQIGEIGECFEYLDKVCLSCLSVSALYPISIVSIAFICRFLAQLLLKSLIRLGGLNFAVLSQLSASKRQRADTGSKIRFCSHVAPIHKTSLSEVESAISEDIAKADERSGSELCADQSNTEDILFHLCRNNDPGTNHTRMEDYRWLASFSRFCSHACSTSQLR